MLFLISSPHFTTHLSEEESVCEPGLIFHYCCTRDLCECVCVCICVHHICVCACVHLGVHVQRLNCVRACVCTDSSVQHGCIYCTARLPDCFCECLHALVWVCLLKRICIHHTCAILFNHYHFIKSKVTDVFLVLDNKPCRQTTNHTLTVIFKPCTAHKSIQTPSLFGYFIVL